MPLADTAETDDRITRARATIGVGVVAKRSSTNPPGINRHGVSMSAPLVDRSMRRAS
jgi:hypothetical protein